MFDRRFICGETKAVAILKENGYTFEQLTDMFGDIPILLSNTIETPNVLLFDYLFGFAYGFLIQEEIDPMCVNKLYISEPTFETTHDILVQMQYQSLVDTIPLYGIYLDTTLDGLCLGKIYPALYVPSQPYDVCTMGWDAYDEIYRMMYKAMIDDDEKLYVFANSNMWNMSTDVSHADYMCIPKSVSIIIIQYSRYMIKQQKTPDYEKRLIHRNSGESLNAADYFCSPTYLSNVFG